MKYVAIGIVCVLYLAPYIFALYVLHKHPELEKDVQEAFVEEMRRKAQHAVIIMPKTDKEKAQERLEHKAHAQGIEGLPIDEIL